MVMGKFAFFSLISRKGMAKEHKEKKETILVKLAAVGNHGNTLPPEALRPGLAPDVVVPGPANSPLLVIECTEGFVEDYVKPVDSSVPMLESPLSPAGSDEQKLSGLESGSTQHSGPGSPYAYSHGGEGIEHSVPLEQRSDPGVYFDNDKEGSEHLELVNDTEDFREARTAEDQRSGTAASECCRSEGQEYELLTVRRCKSDLLVGVGRGSYVEEDGSTDLGIHQDSPRCFSRASGKSHGHMDKLEGVEEGENCDKSFASCPADIVQVDQPECKGFISSYSLKDMLIPGDGKCLDVSEAGIDGRISYVSGVALESAQEIVDRWRVLSSKSMPDLARLTLNTDMRSPEKPPSLGQLAVSTQPDETVKVTLALQGNGHHSMARVHEWVNLLALHDVTPPEDWEQGVDGENSANDRSLAVEMKPKRMAAGLSSDTFGDGVLGSAGVASGSREVDVEYANRTLRLLDRASASIQLSGRALAVLPSFAGFHYLKSLQLPHNGIDRIPCGSFPRSLHVLDLSHNKLCAIEGLRELTRLRVLDISYNRIARIGHGLAGCTSLRELYLAGNKVSEVEGMHRLLKLTILDLAHNKVTSTKALGQLAANYASMQALNLVGNPVHVNLGDDAFRRYITGLLPNLVYLNQHPVKAVSARDATTDNVARAALGSHQSRGAKTSSSRTRKTASSSGHHRPHSSGSGTLQPRGAAIASGSSRSSSRTERVDKMKRRQAAGSSSIREQGDVRSSSKRSTGRIVSSGTWSRPPAAEGPHSLESSREHPPVGKK